MTRTCRTCGHGKDEHSIAGCHHLILVNDRVGHRFCGCDKFENNVYELSAVLASLPAGTWSANSERTGLSLDGSMFFILVFPEYYQAADFLRTYYRTWISTEDRSCYLDYQLDWKDVHGYGVILTTYDPPRAIYGGKRTSELR